MHVRFEGAGFEEKQQERHMWSQINEKSEEVLILKELLEAEKRLLVIERRSPVEHGAQEHQYVYTGQTKGHGVITMADDSQPEKCRGDGRVRRLGAVNSPSFWLLSQFRQESSGEYLSPAPWHTRR